MASAPSITHHLSGDRIYPDRSNQSVGTKVIEILSTHTYIYTFVCISTKARTHTYMKSLWGTNMAYQRNRFLRKVLYTVGSERAKININILGARYFAMLQSIFIPPQFSSVHFSRWVVSDSLRPHESQHARPPCPTPTPRVHSDLWPSSQWCHPAILSSVVPFSSAFNQDYERQIF